MGSGEGGLENIVIWGLVRVVCSYMGSGRDETTMN